MNNVYDALPGIVIETTFNGEIIELNAYTRQLLGKENFSNIRDVLTKGSAIFFETYLLTCFKEEVIKEEVFLTLKGEAERIPALFSIKMLSSPKDHLIFNGLLFKNRIEQEKKTLEAKKKAEQQIIDNEKYLEVKKDLAVNQLKLEKQLKNQLRVNNEQAQLNKVLAHDLQEPIRKIMLLGDRILNNKDVEYRTKLQRIIDLADRSQMLLKNTQEYGQLEEIMQPVSSINLDELIQNLITKNFEGFATVSITNEEHLSLLGDAKLLERLFEELIRNSIQFVKKPVHPTIHLSVDRIEKNSFAITENLYEYENFFRIIYTDNSQGFHPNFAHKIFELYQKLEDSENFGMGLSFCRKIAELHGGSLEVHFSEAEHRFVLLIPEKSHR